MEILEEEYKMMVSLAQFIPGVFALVTKFLFDKDPLYLYL